MKPTKKQLTEAGFECRNSEVYFEEYSLKHNNTKLSYYFIKGKGVKYFELNIDSEYIELKGVNTVAKAIEFWWMILGDKIN